MEPGRDYGIVDIDAHIIEPPNLWREYVEPRFRDQAIRVERTADGMNRFVVRGRPSRVFPALTPLYPGQHDVMRKMTRQERCALTNQLLHQDYAEASAEGAIDPSDRVAILDRQGIEAALLFPTLGLSWEEDVLDDPEYTLASMRAYNTWITEFCATAPDRLWAVAHLSLLDPDASAAEAARAARRGARAVLVRTVAVKGREPSHPCFDRLWATLEDHDLALTMHVLAPQRTILNWGNNLRRQSYFARTHDNLPTLLGLSDLVLGGTLSRFPRLRVGCMEVGAEWVPWLLRNMDDKVTCPFSEFATDVEKPSDVFRRQVWVTPEFSEDLDWLVSRLGTAPLMAYTDYPHPESSSDPLATWRARSAGLDAAARRAFFRTNALALVGLARRPAPAATSDAPPEVDDAARRVAV